jgi:hypothetical protein
MEVGVKHNLFLRFPRWQFIQLGLFLCSTLGTTQRVYESIINGLDKRTHGHAQLRDKGGRGKNMWSYIIVEQQSSLRPKVIVVNVNGKCSVHLLYHLVASEFNRTRLRDFRKLQLPSCVVVKCITQGIYQSLTH